MNPVQLSSFTYDLAYLIAVVFGDTFLLLAGAFIGASFLYGLVVGTIFIMRNI